jgi:hypothetical protein
MRLIIHDPTITEAEIAVTYTYEATEYSHRFALTPHATDTDATVHRLARWLAVIHSCYLFSIDYFTELATDFPLTDAERAFFEKTIFKGMAEFRYVNTIPIATKTIITTPSTATLATTTARILEGRLLLNGGGKDGLVSASLLRAAGIDFELFQIGTGVAQSRAAKILSKTPVIFQRFMDERRMGGQYQGHRPTSAAIAIAAILTAYVTGKRDVIASNESSANEPTLEHDGIVINHQYSKSLEFEKDINDLLKGHEIDVRYFSLLRPLHEVQIVKILESYPEVWRSFISCNHGFRKGIWCMKCAKCAFIALVTTGTSPELARAIFETDQALATPALFPHIQSLVDPHIIKPLECVGTLTECQVAAYSILKNPSLTLSPELRNLFEKTSSHITQEHVSATLHMQGTDHLIPHPGYTKALNLMKHTLR